MLNTNKFNSHTKEMVVKEIVHELQQHYIFPEVSEEISKMLKRNNQDGKYSEIDTAEDFCEVITKDMYKISNDKHLKVFYRPETFSIKKEKSIKEREEEEKRRGRIENYGFHKVERLLGNIGYIDFRRFYSIDISADTVISVMNTIVNTEALIFDLRKNGGGRVEMVAFLTSFLLEESTHINSIYTRSDDSLTKVWTQRFVPGKQYLNKPVFILTSDFTFSGGEEFAYNLKHLERAKIIGEVTGGGAHPGIFHPLTENIRLRIPNRRSINPITNSNWEGTGVIPDVQIEKESAFKYAYKEALTLVKEKYDNKQNYPYLKQEIEEALENIALNA